MNDAFITNALQHNRYLKAIQLVNRFEEELRNELERIGDDFIAQNRALFVDGADADWNNSRSSGGNLAFARVDYDMDRTSGPDSDGQSLTFNLSFRWVEATAIGHRHADSVLTVLSYKIKHAADAVHRQIKEATQDGDWDVYFAADAYNNSPGIIYYPVESAADIDTAHDTLLAHFSEFGDRYGTDPK